MSDALHFRRGDPGDEDDAGRRWRRHRSVDTSGETCRQQGHDWFNAPAFSDPLCIRAQCRTCTARRLRHPAERLPAWEGE